MTLPERIGARVRRFRAAANLTQEQLAVQMQLRGHTKMAPQRIADIENHRRKAFRPEELVSLARCLNISITELLGAPDRE